MMTDQALSKYSVPTGHVRVADDGSVIHDPPTGNAAGEDYARGRCVCGRLRDELGSGFRVFASVAGRPGDFASLWSGFNLYHSELFQRQP